MFKSGCCFIHYHPSTSHSSVPKTPNRNKKPCCPGMPGFFGLDSRQGGETVRTAMVSIQLQLQHRLCWEIPLYSSPSSLSSSSSSSFTSSWVTINHILTINDLFHGIPLLLRPRIHPTFRNDHPTFRLRVRQQPAFARPSTNSWKLCDLKSWGLCAAQKQSTCGCFQK